MRSHLAFLFVLLGIGLSVWGFLSSNDENTVKVHRSSYTTDQVTTYLSADTRYTFNIRGIKAQIPYATNMILSQSHPEVTRLIIAIHSSSYNPDTYLKNSLAVLAHEGLFPKKTLIIAPAFYHQDKTVIEDSVIWRSTPFWGSSRALFQNKKITLSAYEILDDILSRIITSPHFPNLTDIVILGHSAGGQLVNRYADSNLIEDTLALDRHISMRYLVMAPSSYVYLDGKRATGEEGKDFSFPLAADKKYNRWGYGLEHLYQYHKRHHISADTIRGQYRYRSVLYLVGSKDTGTHALDRSPSAMLEGLNRLERLKTYYRYLHYYYGKAITEYHSMAIIPNAGHSGKALMLSQEGYVM